MTTTDAIHALPDFDITGLLQNEQDIAEYLHLVLEDGDAALLAATLGDIARARGMRQVATEAGVSRESLYRSLSAAGNPTLATTVRVIKALGMRLAVQPA